MSEIRVNGCRPLSGEIKIQGSKNGALPMLAASILQKGTIRFTNVPTIQDVSCMVGILESAGCVCRRQGDSLTVDASGVCSSVIPREYVGKMRSSILVMGALLGRLGEAVTWYPGGCSIGSRPVELHLKAFSCLGAEVKEEEGRLEAFCTRLTGGRIHFPFSSVGATENALLAAVLAEGRTVIEGAAREPEIESLCRLLNQMGGRITGGGSSRICVEGVKCLHGTEFRVPGDRIAAGTYLAAIAAAGGRARLWGAPWESMEAVIRAFRACGGAVEPFASESEPFGGIEMRMETRPHPLMLSTGPYPGFPTDLQSPMLAVLSLADGESRLKENVFEGRFRTAGELCRMGAQIQVSGREAVICGRPGLSGAGVKAWDLRGGAALVAAALAAEGETRISDCIHIERGYEDICRDIRGLGGDIRN
ncbi:MAG: UDP-N-acetylglucosamine 1-carboxyvinyltransferase [Lachnospiraceae bacterium]|nr:UDP-N-acetylglucosamine 1-carboxyvinyltransferase [Lachnospiraceae bacterium]